MSGPFPKRYRGGPGFRQYVTERIQAYYDCFLAIIATMIVPRLFPTLSESERDNIQACMHGDVTDHHCATLGDFVQAHKQNLLVFLVIYQVIHSHWMMVNMGALRRTFTITSISFTLFYLFAVVAAVPITSDIAAVYHNEAWAQTIFFVSLWLLEMGVLAVLITLTPPRYTLTQAAILATVWSVMTGLCCLLASVWSCTVAFWVFICLSIVYHSRATQRLLDPLVVAEASTATLSAGGGGGGGGGGVGGVGGGGGGDLTAPLFVQQGSRGPFTIGMLPPHLKRRMRKFYKETKKRAKKLEFGRLEAFLDGNFSIVATLIMLDITPPNRLLTSKNLSPEQAFNRYWSDARSNFAAAILAILFIGCLWVLMLRITFLLRRRFQHVTAALAKLTALVCMVSCLVPFCFSLVTNFPKEKLPGKVLGVLLLTLGVLYGTLLGFLLWSKPGPDAEQVTQAEWELEKVELAAVWVGVGMLIATGLSQMVIAAVATPHNAWPVLGVLLGFVVLFVVHVLYTNTKTMHLTAVAEESLKLEEEDTGEELDDSMLSAGGGGGGGAAAVRPQFREVGI